MRNPVNRLLRRNGYYRAAFGTVEGQEVLADLFRFCGLGRPSHTPGDPYQTAYLEGMRRVGLRVAAILNMSDADAMRIAQSTEASHD